MMLLTQCLELAVIAWLPGAAIFRLPWLDRQRRAGLDAEERLFWAVVLSVAVSLSVVLALAALNRYSFRAPAHRRRCVSRRLRDPGSRPSAARTGRASRRTDRARTRRARPVGLWRFFPPSEYIIGGKDPGTYMNEGIQIAQRGALVFRDPVVASVPPFARDLFFPSHQRHDYYGTRFMGFFITEPRFRQRWSGSSRTCFPRRLRSATGSMA